MSDRQGSLDDLIATLAQLGIEPIGGDFCPQVWTEHRVAGKKAAIGLLDQAAPADLGHLVLVTPDGLAFEIVPATSADPAQMQAHTDLQEADREAVVEVGTPSQCVSPTTIASADFNLVARRTTQIVAWST